MALLLTFTNRNTTDFGFCAGGARHTFAIETKIDTLFINPQHDDLRPKLYQCFLNC